MKIDYKKGGQMFSLKRAAWSAIVAVVIEFYAFNFVARNINIIATRSLAWQIMDYVLNFAIFFVAIYLVITIIVFIIKWLSPRTK